LAQLRLGLLSTARINDAIIAAAAASPQVEVVAVGSRDAGRAAQYAEERSIPRSHGSYEELLADDGVDAVYVSTPNGLHAPWARAALEAGRHVLCEKPVDADPEVVEGLFALATERGLVFTEAFMWRHLPQTQAMCDLVAQGAVGELRMIRVWSGFMLEREGDPRLDPAQQGGALMDIGCYCVSAARLLAGEPDAVTAQAVRDASRPDGVDMRVAATMRFPGSVLAHFDCAFDLPMGFGLQVVGSEAVIEVDDPWFGVQPGIRVRAADGTVEEMGPEPADPYRAQLEDLAGAIADGRRPLLDRAEVVGQARSLQALLRAMSNDEEDVR
jgi:D-xylose 1-dehydrogenase (NADP+, D-xylono-1,5-lactone-forming)